MANNMMANVKQYIKRTVPLFGTTLLCSSSKDMVSYVKKTKDNTVFTEVLSKMLTQGNKSIKERFLTFDELHNITYEYYVENNLDPLPVIHSPKQEEGNVANFRIIPNPPWINLAEELEEKLDYHKIHSKINNFIT